MYNAYKSIIQFICKLSFIHHVVIFRAHLEIYAFKNTVETNPRLFSLINFHVTGCRLWFATDGCLQCFVNDMQRNLPEIQISRNDYIMKYFHRYAWSYSSETNLRNCHRCSRFVYISDSPFEMCGGSHHGTQELLFEQIPIFHQVGDHSEKHAALCKNMNIIYHIFI